MADVSIKYNGSSVAELDGTGSKTLKTSGKYCEGNVEVTYTPRLKEYRVNVPTAVAAQYVTLVSGDPDVAAHYADDTAMVTVRKMTNNSSIGTALITHTNHKFGSAYGTLMNYKGESAGGNGAVSLNGPLTTDFAASGYAFVRCTSAGDIKVYAQRTNNNFGGADYIITFSW